MENIHIGVFKTFTRHAVPSVSAVFSSTLQQAVTDPGAVGICQFSMKLLFFLFLKDKHTNGLVSVPISSLFMYIHVHILTSQSQTFLRETTSKKNFSKIPFSII